MYNSLCTWTSFMVSWDFKMVSQFGSLGYTIMGKTADLTVVQKTIIGTLHKEDKPQTFIAKEAGCSQSAVSKHVNRKLSGRKKCGRKRCTTNREYEDCQAKSIQEFGWTSQGMDWGWGQDIKSHHTQTCQGIWLNKIKSNKFYCHITTAHVPWWVKFLRACSRQCRNNLHIDSTYLQTYTEDNVQNTHTYTQYMQCTIKTYLQLSIHILHSMYTFYIMYTYTHNSMQKRCNRLYIGWIRNVMDVHWMVSSGSRCPVVQSPLFRWEQVLYFIWKPRSWNLEEGWRSS